MSGDVFLHLKHKYSDLFTQYKENSGKKKRERERENSVGRHLGIDLLREKCLFKSPYCHIIPPCNFSKCLSKLSVTNNIKMPSDF